MTRYRVTVLNKRTGRVKVSLSVVAEDRTEAFSKARCVDRTIMPHDFANTRFEEV